MKKLFYPVLAALLLLTAACGTDTEELSKSESNNYNTPNEVDAQPVSTALSELTDGVDFVLSTLEKLKAVVEDHPD